MYQSLSRDYDRFVNWKNRLAFEMPFITQQIAALQRSNTTPLRILDAACGTGMHAISLAGLGHTVSGADLVPQMVRVSRRNARDAGQKVDFRTASFGQLAQTFPNAGFDLLLCLGNSLPHLLSPEELSTALRDFAACLRPGGMMLLQNRNFDAVMAKKERWMDPQTHREGEREWLFQRWYDFELSGLIRFNILTLARESDSDWKPHLTSTLLRPLLKEELTAKAASAGFTNIRCFGSMQGEEFHTAESGNLILTAIKK